ncbi:MAG: cysteine-rich CWC family protein [Planctomycetes bacterium]|nr:cysteine-rich CWC family protein [Planctomycetota bacterium]
MVKNKQCPRCAATFDCSASCSTACWCAELPLVPVSGRYDDCLCRKCLMSFATVINCIDGRFQTSVNAFVRQRFDVPFVDTITEAGPVGMLCKSLPRNVEHDINISVDAHDSNQIAVVAHEGCAGNPASDSKQQSQCLEAAANLRVAFGECEVIALWATLDGKVIEL